MLTRVLGVVTALLAALVIHQYNQIGDLRGQVADAEERAQKRAVVQARTITADSMDGTGTEVQRTIEWLQHFYQEKEGLQRPDGLWIEGHPDYEGISAWVFDVYLRNRLRGENEDQARKDVEDAIRQSDEWRAKHRG